MISKLFFDTPKSCMKFWMNLRANGILPSYFDQIELLDIGQLPYNTHDRFKIVLKELDDALLTISPSSPLIYSLSASIK